MSWLSERRALERARHQANVWSAGLGGRSGLPRPMPNELRSRTYRHPVVVSPGSLPGPGCPPPPTPWAWYRGDDLTGYADGELVPSWPDRAGGAGSVEMIREWEAGTYASDLIGGQPGIHDPDDMGPYYHVDIARAFPDGVTFGVVIDGPGDIAIMCRTEPFHDSGEAVLYTEVLSESDPGEWSLTLRSTDTSANTEWASNFDLPSWGGPTLILVSFSDDRMTAWRNDGELIVDRADISTAVARAFDKLIFWGYVRRDDDPQIAEVLVWDHALDAAERSQAWDYVECRYSLEADTPEPWAWYRGDDLDGYSNDDPITTWGDRAGGIGDLTTGFDIRYAADAVNGEPGIRGSGWTTGTPSYESDGAAFAMVVDLDVASVPGTGAGMLLYSVGRGFQINDGRQEIYGTDHWIDPAEPLSGPHFVVGSIDSNRAAVWVDGVKVGEESTPQEDESTSSEFEIAILNGTDAAEFIVWNRGITDAEADAWWAYARDRYGLGS